MPPQAAGQEGAQAGESRLEQTAREETARQARAEAQRRANAGQAGAGAQRAAQQTSTATAEQGYFDRVGLSFKNSIDDLVKGVKNIPNTITSLVQNTYYAAKLGAGLTLGYAMGGISTFATAGGFIVGKILGNIKNKEKTTFKQIANEGAIGSLLGGMLHYIFTGSHYVGNAVANAYGKIAGLSTKAGLGLSSIPIFMTAHEYVSRALVSDYKPKTWEERKKDIGGTMALLGLPVMANFCFVPPAYNLPVAAGVSTVYNLGRAKPEKKKEIAPQPGYVPQPAYQPGPA